MNQSNTPPPAREDSTIIGKSSWIVTHFNKELVAIVSWSNFKKTLPVTRENIPKLVHTKVTIGWIELSRGKVLVLKVAFPEEESSVFKFVVSYVLKWAEKIAILERIRKRNNKIETLRDKNGRTIRTKEDESHIQEYPLVENPEWIWWSINGNSYPVLWMLELHKESDTSESLEYDIK